MILHLICMTGLLLIMRKNDYNSVQHKRSARYEILLNYVRKYHKEKEDLFREVLTYDYYLA